jgi:threonylcarbamoyladenosine tRNA methylthiotransferase MtaB
METRRAVYLTTLGCRLNEAELARWQRQLGASGIQVVGAPELAQLMVVNTCAVTAEAARKSRKLIGRLHRQNPTARLVVTGCFAELEPARAAELTGVDLVIGNSRKEELVELIAAELATLAMPALAQEPGGSHLYREARTRAFVKVQDGCRNRCAFCIVTIARGDERSRSIDDVVAEVRDLCTQGHREVVLTGVHLGGYGSDLGTDLSALVRAVLADTDVARLRLSSVEPWDLPADFGALWENPRLMPHLHLPLQSGSDSVLKRMARRCPVGAYRQLVDRLRERIPDLSLTTDLIVGFPGEGEAEHRDSLEFVASIGFAHSHIFCYSPRRGTTAARMANPVDEATKRQRSREAHAVAARTKTAHLYRFLGQVRPVLWEGPGEACTDGLIRYWGYTDNYLRVEAVVTHQADLENRITAAALRALAGDPPQHYSGNALL